MCAASHHSVPTTTPQLQTRNCNLSRRNRNRSLRISCHNNSPRRRMRARCNSSRCVARRRRRNGTRTRHNDQCIRSNHNTTQLHTATNNNVTLAARWPAYPFIVREVCASSTFLWHLYSRGFFLYWRSCIGSRGPTFCKISHPGCLAESCPKTVVPKLDGFVCFVWVTCH